MTVMEPVPIPTNDLLRHIEIKTQIHGNEVAWVRSISGESAAPTIAVGLGAVTLFGRIDIVRERLAALLGVVDSAITHPELWPAIGLRDDGHQRWTREPANPFVAFGNAGPGPEMVRPVATDDKPG